jgi:Fe2+ transport system protein FeoA
MQVGHRGTLHAADVRPEEKRLLEAMGLTEEAEIRLCKTGEPCIVQVHATRLALSAAFARRILVMPA